MACELVTVVIIVFLITSASISVLKIDTNNSTVTLLNMRLPEQIGNASWISGALAMDGCIYFMPVGARCIKKLNPENGADEFKYSGTIATNDGYFYGIPDESNPLVFGRFNPMNQK